MELMYRFKFIALVTILLVSCKNNSEQSKTSIADKSRKETNFTCEDLIGKTFYYLNSEDEKGLEYVQDKGAGVDKLVFKKGKIDIYRPIEWANYNIIKIENYDDYLVLNIQLEGVDRIDKIKIDYNFKNGLLKESHLDKEYELKYIDSLILFDKNSKYKYVVDKPKVNKGYINLDFKDYKKNKSYLLGDKETKSESNWLEDKEVLKSISGDFNNDNFEDKILCVVPEGKRDSESEVETLILLGTIGSANDYSLYLKSNKIMPCHLCEFDNFSFIESFYLTKLEGGVFTFSSSNEHELYSFEYLDFVFEYNNKGNFVLTKMTRAFEDTKDIENINLPPFDVTLKDFDVYYFIKKALQGTY